MRSLAYDHLGRVREAVRDCQSLIEFMPSNEYNRKVVEYASKYIAKNVGR
jgi:hypothetical protein